MRLPCCLFTAALLLLPWAGCNMADPAIPRPDVIVPSDAGIDAGPVVDADMVSDQRVYRDRTRVDRNRSDQVEDVAEDTPQDVRTDVAGEGPGPDVPAD